MVMIFNFQIVALIPFTLAAFLCKSIVYAGGLGHRLSFSIYLRTICQPQSSTEDKALAALGKHACCFHHLLHNLNVPKGR